MMNAIEHFEEIISYGPMGRGQAVIHHLSASGSFVACVCKRIELENGGSISVQAGQSAYCTPRNNAGPYTSVEVGFPRGVRIPETWKDLADTLDDWPHADIYGHVPVAFVRDLILANCPKLREELAQVDAQLTD